jgi:hypothetical protein
MTDDESARYESVLQLARSTLITNVSKAALKQLRSLEKPWSVLPKAHQETVLREVQDDISLAIFEAVDLIASDGRTRFRAKVDQVTFKDGVKALLSMGNSEYSHELADVQGGTVLVVIEDPARYSGEGIPQGEEDQRSLQIN